MTRNGSSRLALSSHSANESSLISQRAEHLKFSCISFMVMSGSCICIQWYSHSQRLQISSGNCSIGKPCNTSFKNICTWQIKNPPLSLALLTPPESLLSTFSARTFPDPQAKALLFSLGGPTIKGNMLTFSSKKLFQTGPCSQCALLPREGCLAFQAQSLILNGASRNHFAKTKSGAVCPTQHS